MRKLLLALAATAAFAAPANAAIVFSDNFDGEAGGSSTVLNYTGFAQWDVFDGTVDLLNQPNSYGIACAGGSGSCVDLDGSTGDPGTMITKEMFAFKAGDTFTLTFDLSGSQRTGPDGFVYGFQFVDPDGLALSDAYFLNADEDFGTYAATGDFGFDGNLKLIFRADPDGPGSDNIGLILDNVSLDISPVPEPASWAMMIAGFGLVGGAMRNSRRRPTAAIA
ncbi:PEP-CTERM protein-sorting domain-containing protein [Sphingomonas laterariae]|uniref:PEP-CTERM protein-sorting domain-containing protein n=1 Tax=Edaphosphingomonas laterariae TaxID=861865 RepID=A0A239CFC4_9SPHN|nr:PEPxxWA-CTERM sorting domain-containing protein [Sphingomonas laterariae]SNS18368.1 PEP-CTERM protein-sorting domain-containing protein [Sphingomonas laterariae]